MTYIVIWISAFSVLSFLLFAVDKFRAKARRRRIPEATLMLSALLGGSLGAMLAMQIFRHKTQKMLFILGLPLCLLINAAAVWFLLPHF